VHQRETALSLELHSGTPRLEGSLTAATDYVCLECRRTASCDRSPLLSSKYIQFSAIELAPVSGWLDKRVADMLVRC
jgi:hypothetical protein